MDGWVNIDLFGTAADVVWDLQQPLPLRENTVDAIFHEHFLEHLPLMDALQFSRECWRLMRKGGVLRAAVPDFGRYLISYVTRDGFLDEVRPARPTPLLAVAEVAYLHKHRSVWDAQTLCSMLREVGFTRAEQCEFGNSALDPVPDNPDRRAETLYVEAVR